MTDENIEMNEEPINENEKEIQEASDNIASEEVEKAREHGHISKEEWIAQGKDPNKWKSPQEFNEFGDHYNKLKPHLDMLKREISKRDTALDAIVKHIEDLKLQEREKVKQEYEIRLNQAMQMGDIQEAVKLAAQREKEVQKQQIADEQARQAKQQQEIAQVEQEFVTKNNSWYNPSNPLLMEEMRQAMQDVCNNNPSLAFKDALQVAEMKIKALHPELDKTSRPVAPTISPSMSAVNKSVSDVGKTSDDRVFNNLPKKYHEEYEEVARLLSNTQLGINYTKKEFIDDLRRKGEIK